MNVILISGKAQHGKDTSASMLKKMLEADGFRVLIAHYGDLVKYICTQFFGWDGQKDTAGRRLLQYVGTDLVRARNQNYWTDFLVGALKMFDGEWDYVLIPDCRFPNEIQCMKDAGFHTTHVRVVRPGFQSPLTPEQQAHPSETALDDVVADYYVSNDGDFLQLHCRLADLVVELNGFHQMTMDELKKEGTP